MGEVGRGEGAAAGDVSEKERRTSGESSSSTERARRAVEARRCVGKGIWIVLWREVLALWMDEGRGRGTASRGSRALESSSRLVKRLELCGGLEVGLLEFARRFVHDAGFEV